MAEEQEQAELQARIEAEANPGLITSMTAGWIGPIETGRQADKIRDLRGRIQELEAQLLSAPSVPNDRPQGSNAAFSSATAIQKLAQFLAGRGWAITDVRGQRVSSDQAAREILAKISEFT
jgi:hypothetical protein